MKHSNWARNHFSAKILRNLRANNHVVIGKQAVPIFDNMTETETGYILAKYENGKNTSIIRKFREVLDIAEQEF